MKPPPSVHLSILAPLHLGDRGELVRSLQELLCLAGQHTAIDGELGRATMAAVVGRFGGAGCTTVEPLAFEMLARELRVAIEPRPCPGRSWAAAVAAVAGQHLATRPREVEGANRGPWVRLYCGGRDGEAWAWCAGFACWCLEQAAENLGVVTPLAGISERARLSCDLLGQWAAEARLVRAGVRLRPQDEAPEVGDLFLVRRPTPSWCRSGGWHPKMLFCQCDGSERDSHRVGGWHHAGIVVGLAGDAIATAEGNTNDDGSREGYEAIYRHRALGRSKLDFVRTAP